MRSKNARRHGAGLWAGLLLFAAVMAILFVSIVNLGRGAAQEGVAATREAIERAAVLCYATEGFYPPGLGYIEEHYNVQIDYARYAVRYEVFAYNVRPVVRVSSRA